MTRRPSPRAPGQGAGRRHTQPVTTLRLPWPPSLNSIWRAVGGRILLSARGRQYRIEAVECARDQGAQDLKLEGRLRVVLVLSPPDKRDRDLDNHVKAIQDALTHAGTWGDDAQVDELMVVRSAVTKGGAAVITISRIDQEEEQ